MEKIESQQIKLTSFSRGSGCGCKVSPDVLKQILNTDQEFPVHPDLIIGNEHSDDAAVLRIDDENGLISTTDFFTPIVNDPYDFGKIAATNAISDVYAMGGKPILALAILGWPTDKLAPELAKQVLAGAHFICRMAGIPLAGGHTIESTEPIFGLAVNGWIKKSLIKRNNTPQKGDFIFLTKPLGSGIFSAAHKRDVLEKMDYENLMRYACRLNDVGTALAKLNGVHAMTDITGFGLLGHLLEMRGENNLTAQIFFDKIPLFPNLKTYIDQFIYPDITTKNFASLAQKVNSLSAEQLFILCDPQTSGGLLISVEPDSIDAYKEIIKNFNIGEFAQEPVGVWTEPAMFQINVQ